MNCICHPNEFAYICTPRGILCSIRNNLYTMFFNLCTNYTILAQAFWRKPFGSSLLAQAWKLQLGSFVASAWCDKAAGWYLPRPWFLRLSPALRGTGSPCAFRARESLRYSTQQGATFSFTLGFIIPLRTATSQARSKKYLYDCLENEVLEHVEVVQAVRAGNDAPSQFPHGKEFDNPDMPNN